MNHSQMNMSHDKVSNPINLLDLFLGIVYYPCAPIIKDNTLRVCFVESSVDFFFIFTYNSFTESWKVDDGINSQNIFKEILTLDLFNHIGTKPSPRTFRKRGNVINNIWAINLSRLIFSLMSPIINSNGGVIDYTTVYLMESVNTYSFENKYSEYVMLFISSNNIKIINSSGDEFEWDYLTGNIDDFIRIINE